jgi:hypothetical protein
MSAWQALKGMCVGFLYFAGLAVLRHWLMIWWWSAG